MSIAAVQWALNVKNISHTEKLTLITIAECHNAKSGDCFPSQKFIAEVIERDERSVRRILTKLEAKGFLTRKPRYDSTTGKRTSDSFKLNLSITESAETSDPFEIPDERLPDTAMSASEPGLPDTPLPDKTVSTTGHFSSTTGHMVSGTYKPEYITGSLEPYVSGSGKFSEVVGNGHTNSDWLAFCHLLDRSTYPPGPITADNVDSYIEHFVKLGLIELRNGEIVITPTGAAYCQVNYERRMAA